MINETLADAESRMTKSIDALHRDLNTIRTGRASPALLDRISVEYYGTPTPINQIAGISTPEPRQLMITPWDRLQQVASYHYPWLPVRWLLRDRYDRDDIALILIGMPGLEKQFSHYPQFYSRVGFAHQYRPLGQDELLFVLERHWRSLGKTLDPDDFTDAQAIAAIARITRGNFRLLERLFPQIQRVLKINELDTITNDVIEAAQSTLVIGVT